ncbi:hypothetical protein [Solirubrum puertoriconensis]|uniref:Uncharacterized protein n=1 Tax=Solirubrum puertoriconensis TaxID=1751427 RepID=A0A9X0HNA8_SOLP1|nr:hypothetical protein [Solirubrum puertoriconensis]KUG09075.1 hypothetical protein ASU33_19835 [Solirubrum puertoriconensis]
MSTKKKELLADLLSCLSPLIQPITPAGGDVPRGVAKAIRRLAEQIQLQQAKLARREAKAGPQAARQRLTEELLGVVNTYLGEDAPADDRSADRLQQSAAELADKAAKLRARQEKSRAEQSLVPEEVASAAEGPATPPTPVPVRRSRKRPAANPG